MGEMTPDKGVFKRKGSDVWQHRVFIPKDLRATYGGKADLPAKSLGTRDLAEANRRARLRAAEFEREFAAKRTAPARKAGGAAPSHKLSHEVIEQLAAAYAAKLVDQDFAHRASVFKRAEADPRAFWSGEIVPEPDDWHTFKGEHHSYWAFLKEQDETTLETGVAYVLQKQREVRLGALRSAYAAGNLDILKNEAQALLASYEYDEADRLRLLRRLIEVEIATRNAILEEQSANLPAPPELGDDQENPLLSAAAKAWLEEKQSLALTGRRVEDCEAAVALFIEVIEDKPIASYSKGDVREFKAVLRALPPIAPKSERQGVSMRALRPRRRKILVLSR
jgi:uncharacterized protein DUF6538